MGASHKVVILGGGFGGLQATRSLRRAPVDVTLVDRRNFHLFQPLLYQVATGGLSPANIAAPLRAVLRDQENARVLLGEAIGFDLAGRRVLLADGVIPYDTLLIATGSRHHYFGHDAWERQARGLKTVEDATAIRGRILLAFERAERAEDPAARAAWLTFVIVGGGPTGVELAGAVGELAHMTFRRNFRVIDPRVARILLVESVDRVLPAYPAALSARAAASLASLGVTVRVDTLVTDVRDDGVTIRKGDATELVAARTVLWAAGMSASPLGRLVAEPSGARTDRAGRVLVGRELTVAGHPEVFVIGDLAAVPGADGAPLPGVAQVAIQQGRYAAGLIAARLAGRTLPPFRYHDLGNMATIGRAAAVADLGWMRLSGYPAWLAWLFIHLLWLVQFESRILVLVQWTWNYLTRNRSARLITGDGRD